MSKIVFFWNMTIIRILMKHQGSDRTGLSKDEVKPVALFIFSSNVLVFLQGMMRPILKASWMVSLPKHTG